MSQFGLSTHCTYWLSGHTRALSPFPLPSTASPIDDCAVIDERETFHSGAQSPENRDAASFPYPNSLQINAKTRARWPTRLFFIHAWQLVQASHLLPRVTALAFHTQVLCHPSCKTLVSEMLLTTYRIESMFLSWHSKCCLSSRRQLN